MKKIILFLTTFIATAVCAQQILDKYPEGQNWYEGGNKQFFKEFHEILKQKNLKPCDNKKELYTQRFVVYPDANIKFVRNEDQNSIENSPCAAALTKEVFRYLDGFVPAVVDGEKVPTLAYVIVFPDALFEKYKEGYDVEDHWVMAGFPGGINAFRNAVAKRINVAGFTASGDVRIVTKFKVMSDGSMSDIELDPPSGNPAFDSAIYSGLRSVKTKWTPAKIHGVPVKSICECHYNLTFNPGLLRFCKLAV